MQVLNKRFLPVVTALVVLIIFGFGREYLFENINVYMYRLYHQTGNAALPGPLKFFENFNYGQLYYIKFGLTAATAALYYLVTAYSLKRAFRDQRAWSYTGFFFLFLFGLSFVFYLLSTFSGGESLKWYLPARRIADIIQSPLALMLLTPAFLLLEKQQGPPEN